MVIEIMPVGGYDEVGKNMTAIKVGDEVVICDMGFYMQKLVDFEESGGDRHKCDPEDLMTIHAIPDDRIMKSWKDKVKAIVCSHCHLDHIGALPFLAPKYKCPIIGTPFTIEVIKRMYKDDKVKLKNELKTVPPNSKIKVSKNIEIELINITHSTPQTAMIAIHTKEGTIIYANDFKFDNHPIIGTKPNYARLKELGKSGKVTALIVDSIYADSESKTPSEKVARELLKDVLLGTHNENNLIVVTCFSSHLARIKSILDFAKSLGRKTLILGRSMSKYIESAEAIKLVNFSKKAEIIAYSDKIKKRLHSLNKEDRSKYLMIITGGQGEKESVLSKMLDKRIHFDFMPEDHIVFSNKIIPVEPNITSRRELERRLKEKKTRIYVDIHVSGHCAREDLRDLIHLLNPINIIPAHAGIEKRRALGELSKELGYGPNEIHLISNGELIRL